MVIARHACSHIHTQQAVERKRETPESWLEMHRTGLFARETRGYQNDVEVWEKNAPVGSEGAGAGQGDIHFADIKRHVR